MHNCRWEVHLPPSSFPWVDQPSNGSEKRKD